MIREPLMIPLREARPPLVLVVDVGTSGMRTWIFDAFARPVQGCGASEQTPLRTSRAGEATLDPAERFSALCGLIDDTLAGIRRRSSEIAAVATATFWHSLVGLDVAGRPTTRILTWADTRARGSAVALREELDPAEVHARTGATIHASYWPAKLRYLKESQPARFARTVRWVSFGEYAYLRLFGEARAAHGMASATGLYNQRSRSWDEPLLRHLGIASAGLSEISDAPLAGLRPAFARRWPALAAIPWLPAIGDGACSNVGSGAVCRDRAALFLGTSGAIRVVYPETEPPVVAGGWTYHLDARHVVAGGALSNGGNVIAWLAATFPGVDPATLWSRRADDHGLVALPLLAGDRSPSWNDAARAAIAGVGLASTSADIVRAMLEGVAYRVGRLWQAVDAALPGITTVIATGGSLLDRPWLLQLVADTIGRPLVASGAGEGTARGAAAVALQRLGALRDLAAISTPRGRTYRPRAAEHERLATGLARQRALEESLPPSDAGFV